MDPSQILNNYDLSSYMFNANAPIPFHFNWFIQDLNYKRGGTAPTNATRPAMKALRPGFDTTIYKFDSRNSKESDTHNVIKLNDIKKISKIYNSTNIKPEKFARKRQAYHTTYNPPPSNHLFPSKNNPYSSRKNQCNKAHETPLNRAQETPLNRAQTSSASVPFRKMKSSNEITTGGLWLPEGAKKNQSYFLGRKSETNTNNIKNQNFAKKNDCNSDSYSVKNIPVKPKQTALLPQEPQIYNYEIDLQDKNATVKEENPKKPSENPQTSQKCKEESLSQLSLDSVDKEKMPLEALKTQENPIGFSNEMITIHTDASSEPDHEEEDEKYEGKPRPRMFLTAQHFKKENNQEYAEDKGQNQASEEDSMHFVENNEAFIDERRLEIDEKALLQSKILGNIRPKTSEGGRRRRIVVQPPNEGLVIDNPMPENSNERNPQNDKKHEDDVVFLQSKPINLEYIQSLQNQRPPCRKKVQAFNLELNFNETTAPPSFPPEKNMTPIMDRPPSRHKTPPKAIGLDIPNPDNQVFPIKNMYLKYGEDNTGAREDSFSCLDCVKLENNVNLSNFEEKKGRKSSKTKNREEQNSEIIEEMGKKENQRNQIQRNNHPFSATGFNNNSSIKKVAGISKNSDLLNEKALKNNFMNAKAQRNEPVEITITHNKSVVQKNANSANVQVPFKTSLGSDFLSLFANANL